MALVIDDPRWNDFLKSQGPGPALTPDQLAESNRLDQLSKDIQDPSSPNFHKYLQGGGFESMFPGLMTARKTETDWQHSLLDLFQKKYGGSPVTDVVGPTIKPIQPGTGYGNDMPTLPQSAPAGNGLPLVQPPGSAVVPPPATAGSNLPAFMNQQSQANPIWTGIGSVNWEDLFQNL